MSELKEVLVRCPDEFEVMSILKAQMKNPNRIITIFFRNELGFTQASACIPQQEAQTNPNCEVLREDMLRAPKIVIADITETNIV